MGMFDNVSFEARDSMPGPIQPQHLQFQTKDFGCELDDYLIKADGSLLRAERLEEWKETVIPFHGMLNFYTFEGGGLRGEAPGMWFEYEAKFTDGKCVGVECIEISRQPFCKPREILFPVATAGEIPSE
jgi:hypothetical protein